MRKKRLKPRNNLVAIARFKTSAGPHDKSEKAKRRKEKTKLKKLLTKETF